MGVELAYAGLLAPGFTGPLAFIILVLYRIIQAMVLKYKTGYFIDYKKSNWFTETHRFKRENLFVVVGNFVPNLLGLVALSYGFKYASLGDLN
jgi:RsiW-degrading membrane proteinase PrsW (M82 family)